MPQARQPSCWAARSAPGCAFCQVEKGRAPMPLDQAEAERVADAVASLGLRYVVLTAVARDDLADHGAALFISTMASIRQRNPLIGIEVLTPDFWGGFADEQRACGHNESVCQKCCQPSPPALTTTWKPFSVFRVRCAVGRRINDLWACLLPPGSWRPRFQPSLA